MKLPLSNILAPAFGATAWAIGVVFVRASKPDLTIPPKPSQVAPTAALVPFGYATIKAIAYTIPNSSLYKSTLVAHATAALIDGVVISF
ncbi:hypothetical protein AAMO2058_001644200 [Amorphochlora amoebiformis]